MLELLLNQYRDQFGEDFPLAQVEGMREIEVINLIYDCTLRGEPYDGRRESDMRITDAPGL